MAKAQETGVALRTDSCSARLHFKTNGEVGSGDPAILSDGVETSERPGPEPSPWKNLHRNRNMSAQPLSQ